MTFANELALTFLAGILFTALMFAGAPFVPGLLSALVANPIVSASVGAALAAVASMTFAVVALQR